MTKQHPSKADFLITVVGDYIARGDKYNSVKAYSVDVYLTEALVAKGALSVIKNHYLEKALKDKYPDYARYHTHSIAKTVALKEKMDPLNRRNISLLSYEQLLEYAKMHDITIIEDLYPTTEELRGAIERAKEDLSSFLDNQSKIYERRKESIEEKKLLKELNDDLAVADAEPAAAAAPTTPDPSDTKPKAKPKMAAKKPVSSKATIEVTDL